MTWSGRDGREVCLVVVGFLFASWFRASESSLAACCFFSCSLVAFLGLVLLTNARRVGLGSSVFAGIRWHTACLTEIPLQGFGERSARHCVRARLCLRVAGISGTVL